MRGCGVRPNRRGGWLVGVGVWSLFCTLASAQQVASHGSSGGEIGPPGSAVVVSPESSTTAVIVLPSSPEPAVHTFWDRANIELFSVTAVLRGLDYASTRNFQARGRTEVLLPDDVVNNSAGFASLEAAGTVASIGVAYLFHRTGHHKLERWVSVTHASVTAFGDARNYALKSRRR